MEKTKAIKITEYLKKVQKLQAKNFSTKFTFWVHATKYIFPSVFISIIVNDEEGEEKEIHSFELRTYHTPNENRKTYNDIVKVIRDNGGRIK